MRFSAAPSPLPRAPTRSGAPCVAHALRRSARRGSLRSPPRLRPLSAAIAPLRRGVVARSALPAATLRRPPRSARSPARLSASAPVACAPPLRSVAGVASRASPCSAPTRPLRGARFLPRPLPTAARSAAPNSPPPAGPPANCIDVSTTNSTLEPMPQMTLSQLLRLEQLQPILRERRRKSQRETARILQECYNLSPDWRRVTWRGGVGSWKLMRSGRVRLQVCASCCGFSPSRRVASIIGSSVFRKTVPAKCGYRYAYCVEF